MKQTITTENDPDVIGSASQPRPQPIERPNVLSVDPDTPLSTECLVQLIFDAYSSRNHASVKIITPLKPEESLEVSPAYLKSTTELPMTLREFKYGKVGDLAIVVATKEEHACLLSRDANGGNTHERMDSFFLIFSQKPDFGDFEEEHGVKVLAWAFHGTIFCSFMDRDGMPLPVTCHPGGPRHK
ncbi:hypothetical protein ACHAPA_004768 [Fusarium lateritium]